jgi:hypothetical protein
MKGGGWPVREDNRPNPVFPCQIALAGSSGWRASRTTGITPSAFLNLGCRRPNGPRPLGAGPGVTVAGRLKPRSPKPASHFAQACLSSLGLEAPTPSLPTKSRPYSHPFATRRPSHWQTPRPTHSNVICSLFVGSVPRTL